MNVFITGAARGIGRATAERFLTKGARVAVADLDADLAAETAAELGPDAHAFALDVTDRDSFAEALSDAEALLGPLDVLVNNAGIMPAGRFLDERPETTDQILDVNVRGPLTGMQLVLPGMIERGSGHVVNVASMLGKLQLPGLATYVGSKHAVVGLGKAIRPELRGTGVTLSTVLPAVVDTELASGIQIPFARFIRVGPDDIAKAIVASVDNRRAEIAVPGWIGHYPTVQPFVPPIVEDLFRRLVGDDRAITGVDPAGRAAYAERVARQERV